MKVDLPQPEGPISAVTRRASMWSETRSRTLWSPNHALTFSASSEAASFCAVWGRSRSIVVTDIGNSFFSRGAR